jgi:hypothetical protein
VNREQLAHVLRAASSIASDDGILVTGSQSILGTFDARLLPVQATMSIEADLVFLNDPDETKMDAVDGAIGEGSSFHAEFGYYAQGVSLDTAVLPEGWRERLVPFESVDGGASKAFCLDRHDLLVAKLVAGRKKDYEFATALIAVELVQVRALLERVDQLAEPEALRARTRDAIQRCARAAGCG